MLVLLTENKSGGKKRKDKAVALLAPVTDCVSVVL